MPLHPALVHLPLGLAILMPLVAMVAGWLLWTRRIAARGWVAVAALQALLLVSGVVALKSGERDEDLVERVVGEGPLHRHEAAAEQFVLASGIVLVLSLLGLAPRDVLSRSGAMGLAAGSLLVAGLALRVGHAGGQLVYVHGAAAPHVASSGGPVAGAAGAVARSDHDHGRE